MSQSRLSDGIIRLERISREFDYDSVRGYVLLIKEFIRGVRDVARGKAIFDVSADFGIALPQEYNDRLDAVFRSKQGYVQATADVCQWYLLELHAMDLKKKAGGQSIYEPLIQMLELGGDFYEHHGDLCIRDAATLPTGNLLN